MPKLKTPKSVSKRFRITKKKKVMRRATNQNHFNSKDTGKEVRKKRTDIRLSKSDEKNILKSLPYSK
jgi:ribosomal protein L35